MSEEGNKNNEEERPSSLTNSDIQGEDDKEVIFDLRVVLEGFRKCKGKDEQIYLDDYLRAYIELNK